MTELRRVVRADNHGTRPFDTTTVTVPRARLEACEGVLLRLDSVRLRDTVGTFVQGTNNWLLNSAASESIVLYIQANSSIVNTTKPKGLFNLVANGHQYNTLHEVIPRTPEDIIYLVDVQALAKAAPPDTMVLGDTVSPRLVVRNASVTDTARNVMATFRIGSTYNVTVGVSRLGPGQTDTVVFNRWTATAGTHTVTAFVAYVGDPNHLNDTLKATVFVPGPPPPPNGAWTAKSQMPLTPSGKEPKDGSWLVETGGLIYAAKGYKKQDFYAYNPVNDSWKSLCPWPLGTEGKGPSKGSVGAVGPDGNIFATKGNNTQGFWMYDVGRDSWFPKANVPLGLSNKKVKGGTDLVFAKLRNPHDGYLYLLKGYKNEFYRYSPGKDSWYLMTNAPGAIVKWDKGSWLAYRRSPGKDEYCIYAHKAKFHEFYKYDCLVDSWRLPGLLAMPATGSGGSRKAKDGSCGVSSGDYIYSFKGANTIEFWAYNVDSNAWAEKETIPSVAPGSTKKKKVKGGADLVEFGDVLYGMKGNRASNIWLYTPAAFAAAPAPDRDGVLASGGFIPQPASFILSPNPLTSGFVTVRFSSPLRSPATLAIYNAAGRLVHSSFGIRTSSFRLDPRSMPAGVYLVKLTAADYCAAGKLVIQR